MALVEHEDKPKFHIAPAAGWVNVSWQQVAVGALDYHGVPAAARRAYRTLT
jgi:hypothetical protein